MSSRVLLLGFWSRGLGFRRFYALGFLGLVGFRVTTVRKMDGSIWRFLGITVGFTAGLMTDSTYLKFSATKQKTMSLLPGSLRLRV